MKPQNNKLMPENEIQISVWSVDRIARLILGITNVFLVLGAYFISSYLLIGLCFVNLNLIFSSVTDYCPFKNLLKRLGAKEREFFFNNNGELIQTKNKHAFPIKLSESEKI